MNFATLDHLVSIPESLEGEQLSKRRGNNQRAFAVCYGEIRCNALRLLHAT
jgi:hypothetical protein